MGNFLTGINFMLVGMGGVFSFLLILVISMNAMHRLVALWERSESNKTQALGEDVTDEEGARSAAIVAALHYHKTRTSKRKIQ